MLLFLLPCLCLYSDVFPYCQVPFNIVLRPSLLSCLYLCFDASITLVVALSLLSCFNFCFYASNLAVMLIAFISALMSLSLLSDSYPCSHASTLCWYFNHCCDASITLIMLLSQLSWLYSSCHDFISAVMIIFLLWSFYPSKEAVSAVLVYSSLLWHFYLFSHASINDMMLLSLMSRFPSLLSSFYP